MPTVVLCSSASFFKQLVDLQVYLEKQGFQVIIPAGAEQMKQANNYDVGFIKTWFTNSKDYHKKTTLIQSHNVQLEKGDVVLVVNYQNDGIDNYIGGATLMEMAVAFYLHKPIFILNEIPQKSPLLEEIIALNPIVLHGQINLLLREFQKLFTKVTK